jgi:hypothetical protein
VRNNRRKLVVCTATDEVRARTQSKKSVPCGNRTPNDRVLVSLVLRIKTRWRP